jgi:hypothetical protein
MAVLFRDPICAGCSQDIIRDCPATLGVNRQHACPIAKARNLSKATAQAVMDAIRTGAPISIVLDVIKSRLNREQL